MDPSDEFDDIFLDSALGDAAKTKGTSSKSSDIRTENNTDDSSSSSDNSSDSDDSSVESKTKNEGLYNSSSAEGLFNSSRKETSSRYFSRSDDDSVIEVENNAAKSVDKEMSDDDLDDVDDEALNEFFSQKSPKSQTPPAESDKSTKQENHFKLDEESSDEEAIVLRKKKPVQPVDVFGLDDLDDDELADLEVEDITASERPSSKDEGSNNSSATKKHGLSSQESEPLLTPRKMDDDESIDKKDKTPFRITYNGEKKKYHEDEMIFDSSDDEADEACRSIKSKTSSFSANTNADAPSTLSDESVSHHGSSNNDAGNATSKSTPRNPYQKNKPQPRVTTATPSFAEKSVSAPSAPPSQFVNEPTQNRSELHRLGISHDDFKPPKYVQRPNPILHKLNEANRPVYRRQKLSVGQIFSRPFSNMFTCKFQEFNHLQSEMSNVIANSDDNVIVSSPTGSGKTALFEMAMCRLFASNQADGKRIVSNNKKIVYIAPNKALCEERQADWSKRLVEIDPAIVCTTITGDANAAASSYAEIASANLILTTPEKWDSITRRWTEYVVLLGSVKLVLLDEVHMIGEPDRGACLESVIGRVKTIQRAATSKRFTSSEIEGSSFSSTSPDALASNLRFVAVSATLPNLDQLASFIGAGEAYSFSDSYRPVPLQTHVQACGHINNKNHFWFDKGLNDHVPSILHRFSKGRPAIVFCHAKNDTETLANALTQSYSNPSSLNTSALNNFANQANASSLQRFIRCGIAYHHAGLDFNDRKVVEEAFKSGSISCLCATSTLAMGVNLPSHLVVVKGTSAYRGSNGYEEIDVGTLLQMIGRAGRPGFDTSGTAVIMTDSASKSRFENLSHGLKVVESHMLDKLSEALNSEIAQGVITSQEEAVDWISGTLLFRRIQAHPLFYGMNGSGLDAARSFIADKSRKSIEELRKIGAIDMKEDGTFSHSATSTIMSRNFLDLQSMKSITKLPHDAGSHQILNFLARCTKLQSQVRRKEKKHLNAAYKLVKFKYEGPQSKIKIQTPEQKVFVLLQSAIGNHHFEDSSLEKEMSKVVDDAVRILTAVEEYSREASCHGLVLASSHLIRRCIFHGIWGDNDGVLKQIGGVTHDVEAKLKANGIVSFNDVVNSDGTQIARACAMPAAFGDNLRAAAAIILQCTLQLTCYTKAGDDGLDLVVKVHSKELDHLPRCENAKDSVKYSLLVCTDRPGGLLFSGEDICEERDLVLKCPPKFGRVYIRLISNLIGLDEQASVDGNDRIEKSSFSLSPTIAKSITKSKQSQTASKPSENTKKRLFDSHRSSVSNVSDLRIHKRGKFAQGHTNVDCIEINSDDEEVADRATARKTVTPSPHPATKSSAHQSRNLTPTFGSGSTSRQAHSNPYSSNKPNTISSSRIMQNGTKWTQEKRNHKIFQQRAFNSPKDNPYNSYAYDPNDMEKSLTAASGSQKPAQSSILPISGTFSIHKPRYSTFKTHSTKRKSKNNAFASRISNEEVLRQKTAEMNSYQRSTELTRFNDRERQLRMSRAPVNDGFYAFQGDFENQHEPIQRYSSFDNAHHGYEMNRSYGIGTGLEFPHIDNSYTPSIQPRRFPRGDHSCQFTQSSFNGPMSAVRSVTYRPHQFVANPFRPGDTSVYGSTPMSSAAHSNTSGLQRFSRDTYYARGDIREQQFAQNDFHFQQMAHVQGYHPGMHFQAQNDFDMTSQSNQFDNRNYFGGLDPAEGVLARSQEFYGETFDDFGTAPIQPRNTAVHNPYAEPQRAIPPKEIVLQNNASEHIAAADDASLAFEDAFLS